MTNAKEELLKELNGISGALIKCAEIYCERKDRAEFAKSPQTLLYVPSYIAKPEIIYCHLTTPHTKLELDEFLASLDFVYDKGLSGTVWLEDGTWLERDEYDGAEWWAYRKPPAIHAHLRKTEAE